MPLLSSTSSPSTTAQATSDNSARFARRMPLTKEEQASDLDFWIEENAEQFGWEVSGPSSAPAAATELRIRQRSPTRPGSEPNGPGRPGSC
jgi:hypothetical protein